MTSNRDSREVAWYSWSEWSYVRQLLYNLEDPGSMKKGTDFVNVWKSRLRLGVLPVSVELTAGLISAYLGNLYCENNIDQARLSTAMALVRFVNGITDQLQTGLYAQSVQLIAEKINIPDWMVDLRHQATHSQLPGFELLQSGLMVALTWLDKNYWEETASKINENELTQGEYINSHISAYVSEMFSMIDGDDKETPVKDQKKMKRKRVDRCAEIAQVLLKCLHLDNLKHFVNILHQDGFFVLNQKQMHLLGIIPVVNVCDDSITGDLLPKLEMLAVTWKPLFSLISSSFPNFYEMMLCGLFNLSKKCSEVSISHFVCMFILYKIEPAYSNHMIRFIIDNPDKFGFRLLQILLKDLPEAERESLSLFYDIFQPVIGSIYRNRSFGKNINFQLSDLFLKCINLIKDCRDNTVDVEPVVKCNLKWRLLQQEENDLSPMGDFQHDVYLQYLDVSNNHNDLMIMQPEDIVISDKDQDIEENLTGNRLSMVIENLFKDDRVYVEDDDTSGSDTTNEYQLDTASWVDFNISEEELIKTEIVIENNVSATIDASKVVFF